MQFSELQERILEIKRAYDLLNVKRGEKKRGAVERVLGFVGDIGDLAKLVMAKQGYRTIEHVDEKLSEELVDCIRSTIVIASECGIDLESACDKKLLALKERVLEKTGVYTESI